MIIRKTPFFLFGGFNGKKNRKFLGFVMHFLQDFILRVGRIYDYRIRTENGKKTKPGNQGDNYSISCFIIADFIECE